MSAAESTSTIELWASWEGHVINGVYPLKRHLGSSDHSGVFLTEARHATPADLAIKIVPAVPGHAETQLSRWLTAAEIEHPNLVSIFEAGQCQVDGRPYLYAVMEYADQDLAQLLQRRALTEEETREMLAPALGALAFLHEKKFVQGRVKPSNLLVVGDQLKLASDTIRRVGEGVDGGQALSAYDPPEVRETGRLAAGDMWALGVTICEALTRRQPLALHGGGNPVFPVDLSHMFREIVAWCLSRRPSDRPEVAELEASLRGERTVPVAIPAVEPGVSSEPPAATTDVAAPPAPSTTPSATAAAPPTAPSAATVTAPTSTAPSPSAPAAEHSSTLGASSTNLAAPPLPPALGEAKVASPSAPAAPTAAPGEPPAVAPTASAPARVAVAPEAAASHAVTRPAPAEARAPEVAAASAPVRKPAIEVVTEEARAPVSESRQPESRQPESKQPESRQPESKQPESRQAQSRQPPSGGGESKPRYELWAASFGAVLLIAWGGMKLLSNPSTEGPSEPAPEVVADVSPGDAADHSSSALNDSGSSETAAAAETPADATRSGAAARNQPRANDRATATAGSAGRPASTAPATRLASAGTAASPSGPEAPAIHEVIPDVPSSASRTIRGRVRVSVRVIVEPDGTVFAALADDRGPSRYFERVAIDAAKKWTFAPADTEGQRLMLIRFTFTRQGTTANAAALR